VSEDIYNQVRDALRIADSIEAMSLATEEIDKKLGDAYPNGLVAEIEDIKTRLSRIEAALVVD
jgi:hypothetical protein